MSLLSLVFNLYLPSACPQPYVALLHHTLAFIQKTIGFVASRVVSRLFSMVIDGDQVVLDDLIDGDQVDYCNRTTTIDTTLRLPSWHN